MHKRLGTLKSHIVTMVAVLALASNALAADPAKSNEYDKFRNDTYSNKGLMSEQEEVRLGEQVHQQVLQQFRLVRDPDINAYVQDLGERIARQSQRPNLQYRFYVIDDPSVNAFAIPGGFVYVHTGLLDLVQSEDELAAAMAHEVGHVVARHGLRNIKKAQRTALIFGILGVGADIATGGAAGHAARAASELLAAGIITKNSRDFEREADFLGLYNMRDAGFDPNAMVSVFQKLGSAGNSASKNAIGGIFASHPNSTERARNTQAEIQQHLGGTQTVATAAPDPSQPRGSTRPRRAGRNRASSTAGSSSAEFNNMKAALSAYQAGNRNNGQRNRNTRYDPNYDPNANAPATNNRPVLKRKN